jgi:hypothetical protein
MVPEKVVAGELRPHLSSVELLFVVPGRNMSGRDFSPGNNFIVGKTY